MNENDSLSDLAARIAGRALAKREAGYAGEVRRLLDAALVVIRDRGTESRPRVADIVAAAGLSNDAFYRHFPSKDALVAAILEDGTDRLYSYVAHQMAKAPGADRQVRRWVAGVLSQAAEDSAATTRAVLWNAGRLGEPVASAEPSASARLSGLLHGPFAELGSTAPAADATLAAHATFGMLSDYLQRRVEPGEPEVERIAAYCVRALTP
ncbi:TetR/AcrR family transcriptional regulator [Amycolatopsis acidicola]|uniref:TetR/AcrR family transcriptional regulator n=1 Tax=Amycolatopsis acidicola TaxID=2596893 RepID=A0A5N0UXZ5_9PSEU|nr:TetR/AcrR family transcriptional regulator [Amycolatopsis acidicola]KAA9156187.1 TetR/AcrR family transcriptional regulator [Amycolatopsis acidicola]